MDDNVTSADAVAAAHALVPHAIDNSDECSTSSTNATSSTSGENSSNQSLSNQTSSNLSSINRLNLTLENFDQEDIVPENCPYVLTSPRSIEACKIVGIRPVDLLPFRLEDARRELEVNGDFTLEALNVLRTAEDNRRELLEKCREIRNEIIQEEEQYQVNDDITTDSGKGCTSDGSDSSTRSSPDRGLFDDSQRRLRKNNVHSRLNSWYNNEDARPLSKAYNCYDLSQLQLSSDEYKNNSTTTVTFCDNPTLVLHETFKYPHRPTSSSKKLFCNPYGPPIYPRERPVISVEENQENSSPVKKKKAKRSEKMITIKVPISNSEKKTSISRSKSLPRNSKETRKSVDLKTLIDGHDLLDHDRKILHRLASKRIQMLENEAKAQSFRQKWASELTKWKQNKENMELFWQNEVLRKRRYEQDFNEDRLLEAREKLLNVQLQLSLLIEKKQEKADEMVAKAQKRRTEQFLQWRKHEEARRFAVDSAIKELFARDFQYRKELKSHIENRLQNAEKRRRSLRQRSIEHKNNQANHNQEVNKSHMSQLEKKQLLQVEQIRDAIKLRLAKAEASVAKNRSTQRQSGNKRFAQVLALREELETKLEAWRKQVFLVHCDSLEKAEFRAKHLLELKTSQISSENRSRKERHARSLERLKSEEEQKQDSQIQNISCRMALVDQWKAKKRGDHKEVMKRARKAAELRQVIINLKEPGAVTESSEVVKENSFTNVIPSSEHPVDV